VASAEGLETLRTAGLETGATLGRNKNADSTKHGAMVFRGLPLIGQKRPMNGAQLHPLRVGNAGGELARGL